MAERPCKRDLFCFSNICNIDSSGDYCTFGQSLVIPSTSDLKSPPDVVSLILDKTVIDQWCPVSKNPNAECPFDGEKVHVRAEAKSKEGEVIMYSYEVTGGRIVGQGADVDWVLTGLQPGSYSITARAEIGNSNGGQTLTRSVTLQECPECDLGCTCPSLEVSASKASVADGETVTFEAHVTEPEKYGRSFAWTVTNGEIIFGKNTNRIGVRPLNNLSDSVTASVEISGTDLLCNCPTSASEEVKIVHSTIGSVPNPLKLSLDKNRLFLPCRYDSKYRDCPEGMTVAVDAKLESQ